MRRRSGKPPGLTRRWFTQRRNLIKGIGIAATVGLAGCVENVEVNTDDGSDGQTDAGSDESGESDDTMNETDSDGSDESTNETDTDDGSTNETDTDGGSTNETTTNTTTNTSS